jgi:hypothetical protein
MPLLIFMAVPATNSVLGITPMATMTKSQGTVLPLVKTTPPTAAFVILFADDFLD